MPTRRSPSQAVMTRVTFLSMAAKRFRFSMGRLSPRVEAWYSSITWSKSRLLPVRYWIISFCFESCRELSMVMAGVDPHRFSLACARETELFIEIHGLSIGHEDMLVEVA